MSNLKNSNDLNSWLEAPTYRKRSDVIVAEIKRWIADQAKVPGDRLPVEKELMQLFSASKGVIREALKSLEVQGLIRISTGPKGGAVLCEVPITTAIGLLSNYFYFKKFDAVQVYQVKRLLEPSLAADAVGHLTEDQLYELESIIEACRLPSQNTAETEQKLVAEVRFHEIIAEACPNIFLSLICRFLNHIFRNLIVLRKIHKKIPNLNKFMQSNVKYHQELLAAFIKEDRQTVFDEMREHADEVYRFVGQNDFVVKRTFTNL